MSSLPEAVELATDDGRVLAAHLFRSPSQRGAVILSGALGVRQEFYRYFASFLGTAGFTTLTFDYRGVGRSLSGALTLERARLSDWGRLDLSSAIQFMSESFRDVPLLIVGHSAGAQLLGLAKNYGAVRGIYSVAGQSGYWRLFDGRRAHTMWWLVHVVIPLTTRWYGYFPGKRWNMTDLPAGVAREFAHWCRHSGYAAEALDDRPSEHFFSRFEGKVRLVEIYDDLDLAPPRAVAALGTMFSSAAVEGKQVCATDVGGRAVGHFGFFRSSFRKNLWKDCEDFLNEVIDAARVH